MHMNMGLGRVMKCAYVDKLSADMSVRVRSNIRQPTANFG
jgi:hypothetical protein